MPYLDIVITLFHGNVNIGKFLPDIVDVPNLDRVTAL
jgi:hypothetical protein